MYLQWQHDASKLLVWNAALAFNMVTGSLADANQADSEVSSLDNQCTQMICEPGHCSEGLWGIISYGVCRIQSLLPADRLEHQTYFITKWHESSEIFKFSGCGRGRNVSLAVGWCSANCDGHKIVPIIPSVYVWLICESQGRRTYALGFIFCPSL